MAMNNHQGQTNMMSSVSLYETSSANNFNTIQQGVPHIYSSTGNSQYLTPSQRMSMNEKISHADFRYLSNYSQTSYATQYVTRTEVVYTVSAPRADLNSYDSVQVLFLIEAELLKLQRPRIHLHTLVLQAFCLQTIAKFWQPSYYFAE